MASSLEKLLAEEGFRRSRRSQMASRASFRADTVIKSLHPARDSPLGQRVKTERTRSDVARHILRGESPSESSSSRMRRARDNLVSREKIDGRLKIESWEMEIPRLGHRVPNDVHNNKTFTSGKVKESEIIEIGVEEEEQQDRIKDIYSDSDKAYNTNKSSQGKGEDHKYIERKGSNRILIDERRSRSNSDKNLLKCGDSNGKIRLPNPSYDSSVRNSKDVKNFKGKEEPKRENVSLSVPELALDEVAVKATISILNGYIKRFIKDEEFRVDLRHNCFASLNILEDGEVVDEIKSKVITNLEQAIEIVEKAAEGAASNKDLKRASLQLSVITSLNLTNDSKDGNLTSGIPNSRLPACAHLYLSVICKLKQKDRASSKYLLQVFCDSPFSARTFLLPQLWDYLFFPHLSDLQDWYNQEADSLQNTSNRKRKLKLLNKVYNEILDSGTYQIAAYYKDWLTEGAEAPSFPGIHIPTMSFQEAEQVDSNDHFSGPSRSSDPFSPQPMVSKKLYEAVFSHSIKPESYETEDIEEAENVRMISLASSCDVNQTIMYSYEIVKYVDQDTENNSFKDAQDNTLLSDDGLILASKEEWKLVRLSTPPESDMNNEISNSDRQEEIAEENESRLMDLAKAVFEVQQTEDHYSEPIKVMACYEDAGTIIESVPQDFICPLSGKLFEVPVTLETGQTFEQEAIKEWFNKGNRTCPVTGKLLECSNVPCVNSILKRIIDSWKLECCSHLLVLASQLILNSKKHESSQRVDEKAICILENLLTTFGREENLANAKQLISLGGLDFLLQRIKCGDSEEKIRVAALLCCFIEADESCRNYVLTRIDSRCLLEILHTKQPKARRNVVLLLIELLCLSRRKDVKLFLSGLQSEEILNTMHILVMYLQNSPSDQRPWVALLLLHLDLLVEHQKFSIYREEAVDAIVMALEDSLTDETVCKKTCRALLALGGRFSSSGMSLTESKILKQAGFIEENCQEEDSLLDYSLSLNDEEEEEEETIDEWLNNLSTSLLGNGKKSFLETISKCLTCGNSDLVKACLTTIAWLSCALSALSNAEFQISAFSALISGLKQSLENGEKIEHKVLASISLLNFCKIPECKVLLMSISEEITVPLKSLVEVTWTAKQLYAIISGEYH